jgi:hypothetical protein
LTIEDDPMFEFALATFAVLSASIFAAHVVEAHFSQ